ncbi:hypothetical protein JHK85_041464 [Glycine max]|nr:hypothetical protein JHK85_041464 [Glycine max]
MAEDEPSSERWDRLEAAIADLEVTQASMAAKLDLLPLKMDTLLISQHPPSSSSAKAPPAHAPMPTSPPISTPSPMPIPLPCLAPIQPSLTPLLAPFPMSASYLPDLYHPRAAVSCNKLFSTAAQYGCAIAPNDKTLEVRNMTLFEMETEYYGPTMASRKCQPAVFALWIAELAL